MTDEELKAHIQKICDAAPPLTDDQRERIASLLRPVWLERRRKLGTQPRSERTPAAAEVQAA